MSLINKLKERSSRRKGSRALDRLISGENKIKTDAQVEERSYLKFQFPNPTKSGEEPTFTTHTLNFAQNVKIIEKNSSLLTKHSPIGRNGEVFSYTGSKSRTFTIKFDMTLPNIMEHYKHSSHAAFKGLDKEQKKKLYGGAPTLVPGGNTAGGFAGVLNKLKEASDNVKAKANLPLTKSIDGLDAGKSFKDFVTKYDDSFIKGMDDMEFDNYGTLQKGSIATGGEFSRKQAISQILFWSNLIRLSVMGSTEYPHLGPPVVRINHGIMYNNIRCFATDYTINPSDEHGFDLKTMLPNVITVQITLQESRKSLLGFSPKGPTGDNLVGWNEIIGDGYTSLNPIDIK